MQHTDHWKNCTLTQSMGSSIDVDASHVDVLRAVLHQWSGNASVTRKHLEQTDTGGQRRKFNRVLEISRGNRGTERQTGNVTAKK